MKKDLLIIFLSLVICNTISAQQVTQLYTDSVPNAIGVQQDSPTITTYLPAKELATKTAIIIFPGGGYGFVSMENEGHEIARAFSAKGITAFVVKYRLPNDATMRDKSFGPLMDAQQAIKQVRMHAANYNIDASKIGVIGFSAGGHLASTLGTHFTTSYIPNKEQTNLRPDFMLLVYPVITMDNALTHRGSRINLLGNGPSMDKVLLFSSEEQVTAKTPPTYLTHTGDDRIVDVQNSVEMYQACLKNGVPAELHLFPKGDHGFTLRLPVDEWLNPMLLFLHKQGF